MINVDGIGVVALLTASAYQDEDRDWVGKMAGCGP